MVNSKMSVLLFCFLWIIWLPKYLRYLKSMIGLDFHLNLNNEEIGMVIRDFLDVSYSIFIIKYEMFIICNSLHMDNFLLHISS